MEPFRVFNGLDRDLRPVGHPDLAPQTPRMPQYRHFIYGCAKYAAIAEQGFPDDAPASIRDRPPSANRAPASRPEGVS